jgi:hypothetical protein
MAARRTLPLYGWLGAVAMAGSEAAMLARVDPFFHWHTPIAWTGYLLFADAWVWKRRGTSWLRNCPAELLFLACASIPLWGIFEAYNKYTLENWYYIGLPVNYLVRYAGYAWAFATIWPAIFETADLVSSLRDRRAPMDRADVPLAQTPGAAGWLSVAAGAVMLIVPVLLRSSRIASYLAAPVWLGFIFLLDPLNARAGGESILGDLRRKRTGRLRNLLASGLICGVLWEFWNYWGGTKWFYNVPILPQVKVFEMPILGFLGFPPFAVECFVMYVAVRRWLWRSASRPIGI